MRQHAATSPARSRIQVAEYFQPIAGVEHAVAVQAVILDRDEAGFVGPVFEQLAFGQQLVQPGGVVAEPAPQHQVGTARDHADGVDLQHAHAADRIEHIGLGGLAAARLQQCPGPPGAGRARRRSTGNSLM
jgi:hypothetical protein